jgi:hypothetical protein
VSAALQALCVCETLGAPLGAVRFCEGHHRYWRGDKQLMSVSKVIREAWPIKKNFEDAPKDVLEHARVRGVRVDGYFTEFLRSGRVTIAAGEWQEVVERTQAVVGWWQGRDLPVTASPQVILADFEVAGTADWVTSAGWIFDMKNVSALDISYELQIGAYCDLYETQHKVKPQGGALVHVSKAKGRPVSVKVAEVDIVRATADWRLLRQCWSMVQRRIA